MFFPEGMQNCNLLRKGVGTLIVTYRPNKKNLARHKIMVLANTRYAYLVRRDMWKHRCQLNTTVHEDEPKQKMKWYAQSCKLLLPPPE